MGKFMDFMEKQLMPIALKMNRNRYLISIRDGFMVTIPIIIFGAICTIITNLPYLDKLIGENNVKLLGDYLGHASTITMSLTAMIIAFSIGYSLCKKYDVNALYGGFISLLSFFMLIPFNQMVDETLVTGIIPIGYLGAQGMFLAMIVAISATELYKYIIKKGWVIKMPEGVPEAVSTSFASLIPLIVTLATFLVIRILFSFTPWSHAINFIYTFLQIPLMALGNNLISTLIAFVFINLFWFFGLHGHIIVYSVVSPIWDTLSQQNFDAINAGEKAVNIINKQFVEVFFNGLGGSGGVIAITIILLFLCKSKQLKELGKLAAPSNFFNIMETVVFGLPIVMNPIMLIPFLVTPIVTGTVTYMSMVLNIVPIAVIAVPWTVPPVISGMIATQSIAGGLVQLLNIGIAILIYLPFVKTLDKQYYTREKQNGTVEIGVDDQTVSK